MVINKKNTYYSNYFLVIMFYTRLTSRMFFVLKLIKIVRENLTIFVIYVFCSYFSMYTKLELIHFHQDYILKTSPYYRSNS